MSRAARNPLRTPENLRKFAACVFMMFAANQHEMRRRPANLRTRHHESEVFGGNVLSACLETMVHGPRPDKPRNI